MSGATSNCFLTSQRMLGELGLGVSFLGRSSRLELIVDVSRYTEIKRLIGNLEGRGTLFKYDRLYGVLIKAAILLNYLQRLQYKHHHDPEKYCHIVLEN